MARFINLTPHSIVLNSGETISPSGGIARVSASYTVFDTDGVCRQMFGEVENLPDQEPDTFLIVSGMVLAACGKNRSDLVAPATGHPDTIRDQKGHIVSVPGFVR